MNPSHSNDERVPLATVISNQIKKHSTLNYVEVARVGAVTVAAQAAKTADSVLDAALSGLEGVPNAEVRVRADVSRRKAQLTIEVLAQGLHVTRKIKLDY